MNYSRQSESFNVYSGYHLTRTLAKQNMYKDIVEHISWKMVTYFVKIVSESINMKISTSICPVWTSFLI